MKTINNTLRGLALVLLSLLGIVACQRDKYQEPEVTFRVVKTSLSSAFTASEGTIEVSEDGFSISTDASWLTPTLASPRTIKVAIARNESYESRTGNVILKKGDVTQRVSVTQLGLVNFAVVADQEFTRAGGTYTVDLAQMDAEPAVSTDADWITHEIKDGKLTFTVAPLQGDNRTAQVRISSGLFKRTITFSQIYGAIAYADLLGAYTLTYATWKGGATSTAPVTIAAGTEGKTVIIKGLAADIVMSVDLKAGNFQINGQAVANGAARLCTWVADGDGWFNNDNNNLFLTGTWNKSFDAPVYTFSSTQTLSANNAQWPILGFIFWGTAESKEYKGASGNGISRFVQFSLAKNV